MKILIASVTNRDTDVLRPHLESISRLRLPVGVSVECVYIADAISEAAYQLLQDFGVAVEGALPKPPEATYAVSEETHHWSVPTFEWLAREKQRLMDHAREESFDAVFFVDSDLVLGADTLESLVETSKDVVSAVFWTRWNLESPPLPQVWLRHPYELSGRGIHAEEFIRRLESKELMQVGGLGACTLIRSRVFPEVRWWPLLQGLPTGGMWQGEDRHFCVGAERNHVALFADAWPDVFHIYRPSDLEVLSEISFPELVETPEIGDWVSIVIEPLEEKELASHRESVRGRLGALPVLEEIEAAVTKMKVGEARIVEVYFPGWWRVAPYRNSTRNVLVRLVGAKRY